MLSCSSVSAEPLCYWTNFWKHYPHKDYSYKRLPSPTGNYVANFMFAECDSTNLAVQGLNGRRSYATGEKFWDSEYVNGPNKWAEMRSPWAPATISINGACWHPSKDIMFTATEFWSQDTGVYSWNLETGEIKKILHPRTKKVHKDDAGVEHYEYLDDISLINISDSGRYLLITYAPNMEEGRESKRYVVDVQSGAMIPIDEFTKKNPRVRFVDPYDEVGEAAVKRMKKGA